MQEEQTFKRYYIHMTDENFTPLPDGVGALFTVGRGELHYQKAIDTVASHTKTHLSTHHYRIWTACGSVDENITADVTADGVKITHHYPKKTWVEWVSTKLIEFRLKFWFTS